MHDDERQPPLGDLRREVPPPAGMESELARRLNGAGFVRAPKPPRPRWLGAAAALAAVCLLAVGFTLGRHFLMPLTPTGARYALLLYDPATFDGSIAEPQLVEEYKGWAASLGDRLAGGEKLAVDEVVLPGAGTAVTAGPAGTRGVFGGYFIVRAGSLEEAMTIARSCPHLRHGGVISVRKIEET